MFDNSFLKCSGQFWKLNVSFALSLAGSIVIFIAIANIKQLSAGVFTLIVMSATVLGIGGLVGGCLLIRCPQCGAKLLWMSIRGQAIAKWLASLLAMTECSA